MRRIAIIGMPGSGKSTQGQKLAEYLQCPWVSVGGILRKRTEPWIIEQLKTAKLFDDELIFQILREELEGAEDAVIDGFLRTKRQAEEAENLGITEVIEISVPEEEVCKRLAERGREQDVPEVARQRIADYKQMRAEISGVLEKVGIEIKQVDGTGTVDEVFNKVKEVL